VDIKELNADPSLIVSVNAGNYATFKAVHLNKVPVIAAVQGFVLGGGIGICGAADFVIAADDASFGLPELDRGAMGGAAHLQRMFGVQKTRYLFFTGEMISAPEALQLGAIERLVRPDQLRDQALAIAAKIAAKSQTMVRIAKEALNGIEINDLEAQYRWEQGFTLQAYMSQESAETRKAFVEKRSANF
jgi:enoyl-CoA hydratase